MSRLHDTTLEQRFSAAIQVLRTSRRQMTVENRLELLAAVVWPNGFEAPPTDVIGVFEGRIHDRRDLFQGIRTWTTGHLLHYCMSGEPLCRARLGPHELICRFCEPDHAFPIGWSW